MSANPPLQLLAIDPSLAHTGLALVQVLGMHQLNVISGETITTDPGEPLIERLEIIYSEVAFNIERAEPRGAWLAGVVIEDPTESVQRSAVGRKKDPRNIYKLCAAYGAAATAVRTRVDAARVTAVPVTTWYPRSGRTLLKHDVLVRQIRARHPELNNASEHVCFAVGLATWWSAKVAPRVWFERQQRASA